MTARTTTNLEVFGYVSFVPGDPHGSGDEQEPGEGSRRTAHSAARRSSPMERNASASAS